MINTNLIKADDFIYKRQYVRIQQKERIDKIAEDFIKNNIVDRVNNCTKDPNISSIQVPINKQTLNIASSEYNFFIDAITGYIRSQGYQCGYQHCLEHPKFIITLP